MGNRPPSPEPKEGDLIEIQRHGGLYQHWALYVGDHFVIHIAPDIKEQHDKALVKMEKWWKVVKNDEWKVHNLLDEKYEPHSPDEIVKEAKSKVGQRMPYNVVQSNCEHFVTNLRYGEPESRQACIAVAGGATVLTILVITSAVSGIVVSRRKKMKIRREKAGKTSSRIPTASAHSQSSSVYATSNSQ